MTINVREDKSVTQRKTRSKNRTQFPFRVIKEILIYDSNDKESRKRIFPAHRNRSIRTTTRKLRERPQKKLDENSGEIRTIFTSVSFEKEI